MTLQIWNHKKIGFLSKKGSPISIKFCTNDIPDMWLIDRISYRNKSGQITEDVFISNKDLPEELEYWKKKGYNTLQKTENCYKNYENT
jgi:hypothetical protein